MKVCKFNIFILLAVLLVSCSDDEEFVVDANSWQVSIAQGDSELAKEAAFGNVTVSINGQSPDDGSIVITSSAEWLKLDQDTLPADSILAFTTEYNDEDRRREAVITFTASGRPEHTDTIVLTQLSAADNDDNAGDARSVMYIGYGYDIFKKIDDPMSVKAKMPVLDYNRMLTDQYNSSDMKILHEGRLSETSLNCMSAQSLTEFSSKLTEQKESTSGLLAFTSDCKTACDITTNIEEQNIGFGVMKRVVQSCTIDRGVLQAMENSPKSVLPYSDEFSKRLNEFENHVDNEANMKKLANLILDDYGTHVIVQTDWGGRLQYMFTFSKSSNSNISTQMEDEVRFTFGQISGDTRYSENQYGVTSTKSKSAINIRGGSASTRANLEKKISMLRNNGQLEYEDVTKWLATIEYENPENLDVVSFELVPLWDIVPRPLRKIFMDVTFEKMNQSDCQIPAVDAGTDHYEINLTNEMTDFSNVGDDGSLCRILYAYDVKNQSTPILEICNEYVPKIRTDKRVTVVYPIYNNRIRMLEGIFLGDGVHKPALVTFDKSDCYVGAIDSLDAGHIINKLYYITGNLYTNSMGLPVLNAKKKIADDKLVLVTVNNVAKDIIVEYPIVKIGNTFWTRKDLRHRMLFSQQENYDSRGDIFDDNGVLFAKFSMVQMTAFLKANPWYGYTKAAEVSSGMTTKWYLPSDTQVKNLYKHLFFNPKALFKGQVSGFNAEFNGYYGNNNILNNNQFFSETGLRQHYDGEINVISSRYSSNAGDGCLMILKKNYTVRMLYDSSVSGARSTYWKEFNYYPIRLCRSSYFKYPTLEEINAEKENY